MLKIHIVAGLMLAIVIPTSVRTQPSLQAQPLDDREAYKVYAALLPEEWTVREARAKTLVFQAETATNRGCVPSGKPLETDWLPVLTDFTSANATPKLLRGGFDLGVPYVVVPQHRQHWFGAAPSRSRRAAVDFDTPQAVAA